MRLGPLHLGTYPIRGGIEFGVGAWRARGEASVTLKLLAVGLEAEWGVPDERLRCCELTGEDFWRAAEYAGGFVVRLSPLDRTTVEVVSQDPDHGHVHHYLRAGEARFLGNVLHRQADAAERRANHWDDGGESLLPVHTTSVECAVCRARGEG